MDNRKERSAAGPGFGQLVRRTGAAVFAPFEALVAQQYAAPWLARTGRRGREC